MFCPHGQCDHGQCDQYDHLVTLAGLSKAYLPNGLTFVCTYSRYLKITKPRYLLFQWSA
jgi:hypothetical protein